MAVNGVLACTDDLSPYACTAPQNAKNKNYRIEVRAYDTAGTVGTASKTVRAR
jgi:hypothetical protein